MSTTSPVLACHTWPSNAHLIEDVARLYLRADLPTLDATYGRGVWWQRWRPDVLVANDLHTAATVRADFRCLPFASGAFAQIAYDPPYVSIGGRKGSSMAELHDRFGLITAPTSPAGLQGVIDAGLAEVCRVLAPGGVLLVKCQDYISSGRLWPGTHLTLTCALGLGLELVDRFEHVAGVRPQPTVNPDGSPRRQVHARRNLSTLFVLRKGRP